MILIVIILSAFLLALIAANSYLFQNALLWKWQAVCWFMDIVYDNYRLRLS